MSSPKTPGRPEERRNHPVVDLRSWADDHDRIDIIDHFDRADEQRETDERRWRFDADMAELEALEEEMFPDLEGQVQRPGASRSAAAPIAAEKEQSVHNESTAAPAINAVLVSRLIAAYLDPRKETESADEAEGTTAAPWAAEYLLRRELETIADVMRGDDVYPGMPFERGVQFGVEAAVATLNSPPRTACDTVKRLFADLQADMHARVESARRSTRLKAV